MKKNAQQLLEKQRAKKLAEELKRLNDENNRKAAIKAKELAAKLAREQAKLKENQRKADMKAREVEEKRLSQ